MNRRDFLCTSATGTAVLAAGSMTTNASADDGAKATASPAKMNGVGSVMPTRGEVRDIPLPTNAPVPGGKFRPSSRLGFGGVAVGNAFAPTSDSDSLATLEAAWETGVRFFDTSPWYGLGLSERRFGQFLRNHPSDEYVLSTKIGRILTATNEPPKTMWHKASPFKYRYDYTAEGTRRSIEDSLQRLGISRIDVVFIHDLSPDNGEMGARWTEYFDQAVKGAMPELTRMREEGLISAWGFGVNRPEPALRAVEVADPDLFLLACQYSLLDHEQAVEKTFPVLEEKKVSVVVGAPLLAGYLAGRDRYLYSGKVPAGAAEKRERVTAVANRFGVDLRTASLQFAAAPSVVSSVIPGARTPAQVQANAESMKVAIPEEFWTTLKEEGLISRNAAVPATAKPNS